MFEKGGGALTTYFNSNGRILIQGERYRFLRFSVEEFQLNHLFQLNHFGRLLLFVAKQFVI